MSIKLLLDHLESIHKLSEDLKVFLSARVEIHHFRKNEIVYHQGDKLQRNYFIVSGLVVGETFIEDRKHVCWFLKENDFIEDHDSFLNHKLASFTAIAAEDTMLLSLKYQEIHNIYHLFPEMNFIVRHLLEHYLCYGKKRTDLLMILHCRNRYTQFKKEFSWANERLKRAYIASYLNMSAETLSRLEKGDGK